jgi:hypothetical protein
MEINWQGFPTHSETKIIPLHFMMEDEASDRFSGSQQKKTLTAKNKQD